MVHYNRRIRPVLAKPDVATRDPPKLRGPTTWTTRIWFARILGNKRLKTTYLPVDRIWRDERTHDLYHEINTNHVRLRSIIEFVWDMATPHVSCSTLLNGAG